MSFLETPVRRLRLIRACGALVLAAGIGCLPLLVEIDRLGRIIWLSMVAGCVCTAFVYFWLALRTPRSAFVTAAPHSGSRDEQIRYFRRGLCACAAGFPLLSAVTGYELHQLECGATDHVQIWAPLALIYEHFGYWPTMISLPLVGICCCAVLFGKLRALDACQPGSGAGSRAISNR